MSDNPGNVDVNRELKIAIDYINEITNGDIGAGDIPVSFLCASHRVLMMQRKELLKALKKLEPGLTGQQKEIAQEAIRFAEFMNATGE